MFLKRETQKPFFFGVAMIVVCTLLCSCGDSYSEKESNDGVSVTTPATEKYMDIKWPDEWSNKKELCDQDYIEYNFSDLSADETVVLPFDIDRDASEESIVIQRNPDAAYGKITVNDGIALECCCMEGIAFYDLDEDGVYELYVYGAGIGEYDTMPCTSIFSYTSGVLSFVGTAYYKPYGFIPGSAFISYFTFDDSKQMCMNVYYMSNVNGEQVLIEDEFVYYYSTSANSRTVYECIKPIVCYTPYGEVLIDVGSTVYLHSSCRQPFNDYDIGDYYVMISGEIVCIPTYHKGILRNGELLDECLVSCDSD